MRPSLCTAATAEPSAQATPDAGAQAAGARGSVSCGWGESLLCSSLRPVGGRNETHTEWGGRLSQVGVGHATREQRRVSLIKWRLGGAAGSSPAARPPSRGAGEQGGGAPPPAHVRFPRACRPGLPKEEAARFAPYFYYCSNRCSTWRKQSPFTAHSKKNPGPQLIPLATFITVCSEPCAPCCLSQVLGVEADRRGVRESVQRRNSAFRVLSPRDFYTQ